MEITDRVVMNDQIMLIDAGGPSIDHRTSDEYDHRSSLYCQSPALINNLMADQIVFNASMDFSLPLFNHMFIDLL